MSEILNKLREASDIINEIDLSNINEDILDINNELRCLFNMIFDHQLDLSKDKILFLVEKYLLSKYPNTSIIVGYDKYHDKFSEILIDIPNIDIFNDLNSEISLIENIWHDVYSFHIRLYFYCSEEHNPYNIVQFIKKYN